MLAALMFRHPLRSSKAAAALLCLFAALVAQALPATAAPRYAAMAIDANTGSVLHNQAGDEPRYPASLTKMMTLYMTFELIELGRLDYSSKIKMTQEGADAAPSKLEAQARRRDHRARCHEGAGDQIRQRRRHRARSAHRLARSRTSRA